MIDRGFKYRLLETYDTYICGEGRIHVHKGAEFALIGDGITDVYFLNSKNKLPVKSAQDFKKWCTYDKVEVFGRHKE